MTYLREISAEGAQRPVVEVVNQINEVYWDPRMDEYFQVVDEVAPGDTTERTLIKVRDGQSECEQSGDVRGLIPPEVWAQRIDGDIEWIDGVKTVVDYNGDPADEWGLEDPAGVTSFRDDVYTYYLAEKLDYLDEEED